MIPGRILENLAGTTSFLRLDPSRCLRNRHGESGCDRCTGVCPTGAVSVADGLAVEEKRCTGCLSCTAVCPTGALEPEADFDSLLAALAAHRLPVFVIGCQKSGSNSHRQLPCLGMLSAEHLVGLYSQGRAEVRIAVHACADCAAGPVLEQLTARLHETVRDTGLPIDRRIRLVGDEKELAFQEEGLDRRSFFSSLRRMAFRGVATALAPPPGEKEGKSYMDKALPRRRAILLAALASLPAEEAGSASNAFTFSASFSGSCDGCLGCVRACPTAALDEPVEDGGSSPRFDPKRCTGCRLCTEFCLSSAVAIRASIPPTPTPPCE